MASEAQTAIHELHARGWTDTAIGRAVNRDSSLIHQIAIGKKPGTTIGAPLSALAASGASAPAKGEQRFGAVPLVRVQRLRQGKERPFMKPMGKSGQVLTQGASKETALAVADRAQPLPGALIRIVFEVRYKDANGKAVREWRTLNARGIEPEALREAVEGSHTWKEALASLIALVGYPLPAGTVPTGETGFYIVAQGAA